jgi:hypothetical protein
MIYSKKGLLLVIIFVVNVNLYSSTGHDVEVKCPLCNTTTSYWQQLSYSIFSHGLDLKPVGAARIPQPIPKCESCGFAFIEEYFSNEEIQILRNYIINQNVFSGKISFPKYYFLAFALELLDNGKYNEIAYFYICSVWEYSFNKLVVEYIEKTEIENTNGIEFDNSIFIFLMQNAIEKINNINIDSEEYNNMQLIKLDFLRRLGLFNEAKLLIENIRNNENIYDGIFVEIINFQIKLIEEMDMDEHYLNEIENG